MCAQSVILLSRFPLEAPYYSSVSKLLNTTVDEEFVEPALRLVRDYCRSSRPTPELSDEAFVRLGLQRVVETCESGRAFLQERADGGEPVARATFFDALHSARRLALTSEVAAQSYQRFSRELCKRDWLEQFPELSRRAVWAVDGHQIEHAVHAICDTKGERVSAGMIYGLCLHTGLVRPMAPFQGDGRHGHEFPVFKKHLGAWLGADQREEMPIVIGDPAYIDVQFWCLQKIRRQAVVITREKENMKPQVIAANPCDADDPVNRGVEADEYAGYSAGYMRRIRYRDPATGELFIFITTCLTLRPGLIALLYLLRWKIEKAYDVFKNKLFEQKAWANGRTALLCQAHFVALVYNLLILLQAKLENFGIYERKVQDKAAKRAAGAPAAKRVPSHEMIQHAHVLTCQFIRLVRYCLRRRTAWVDMLPLFRERMEVYL